MIKVSVIVPVYNGETHLRECLDCIKNQTLQDIEILCIDDGSIDSSLKILEEYRDSDSRFQIYRQDHKYAGCARNLGMKYATGEYLVFWDCDDFFDLQALEKLYEKAKRTDADVVVCGANQYLDNKNQTYRFAPYLDMKRVPDDETFNRYSNPLYYLNFTTAAAWNKIFNRDYIEKLGLKFQNFRNGEDVYFTMNAIGLAERISVVNEALITYRRNQGSGLVFTSSESPLSPIQAWIDTAENLEKFDGFGEQSFANRAIENMVYLLRNLQDWDAFQQAVEALHSYGLKKMHIFPNEGYYYSLWHETCVFHLYSDTTEQFAAFMMYRSYTELVESNSERRVLNKKLNTVKKDNQNLKKDCQNLKKDNQKLVEETQNLKKENQELKKEKRKLQSKYEDISNSTSFRIGRAFTWLPRKVKIFFKT